MTEKNPEEKKPPKLGWKQKLSLVFNGVSRKEWRGVLKETLADLRKPKEIGILVASSFVPGGWIGYAAYRIAKYKFKHPPANDNAAEAIPEAGVKKKPDAPKP